MFTFMAKTYDFKTATQAFVKALKSFKLSYARMLEFKNDKLRFKTAYNSEYCYHSVLKPGKKWPKFKPSHLPNVSTVKEAKRKDVLALLAEIGASDNVRAFSDDAVSHINDDNCDRDEE